MFYPSILINSGFYQNNNPIITLNQYTYITIYKDLKNNLNNINIKDETITFTINNNNTTLDNINKLNKLNSY